MKPEELVATREDANVDYAPEITYDDWQAMARALLTHIDSQAAQIKQLKEKLLEERAKILMAGEDEVAEAWEYLKDNPRFANEARQQLKAEIPEVEWDG